MSAVVSKGKKKRKFQESWMEEPQFKWLIYEDAKMFCRACRSVKSRNSFVSGCTDFHRSSLTRHQETTCHKEAILTKRAAGSLVLCLQKASDIAQDGLVQLRTVGFMVEENIALSKFNKLIDLQQLNGANIKVVYKHHAQVEEMLLSLTQTVDKTLAKQLHQSNFISLTTDESVDIVVFKKLMILVTVIVDGDVKVCFGKNVDVTDGKADSISSALFDYLEEQGIPRCKVAGLGSDGAAVMTGHHNGVGKQLSMQCPLLIHVHCCAHRLALAVSQSAHAIDAIKKYEETVNHIYNYFNNSPVRYNRLREIEQVTLDAQVTLKEPHSVKWLSLHEAIIAVNKCWPALVACLGANAANDNAVARGLAQKVETYSFIAFTCILDGILPLFTKLSKTFQSVAHDFDKMETMLQVTRRALESYLQDDTLLTTYHDLKHQPSDNDRNITWMGMPVRKTQQVDHSAETAKDLFINELLSNLDRRFPEDGMTVLRKMNRILNPKKLSAIPQADVAQYGQQDLEDLCEKLTQSGGVDPQVFSANRARNDFLLFKLHCRGSQKSLPAFAKELMRVFKDYFPDFVVLMEYFMVVPLNSASCERGFSRQNLV